MTEPASGGFVPVEASSLAANVPKNPILRFLHGTENLAVVLSLAAIVILPLAEILLRAVFKVGISGSSAIVQHMTLFVGMLGGAIAARENRLLALSTADLVFTGWKRSAALLIGRTCAAVVSIFLCAAGIEFVRAESDSVTVIAYGIPTWFAQVVMPFGFGLIAMRLLLHAAPRWKGRAAGVVLAAALVWVFWKPLLPPEDLATPALVLLVIATVLGAPVFSALGGAALILFWKVGLPTASIPLDHYRLVVNPSLPAIPLFTLAGYFLAEGGASKRLVRVFQTLFSQFRGGPAIVTALVCAFFTSFTGASGVTILALGGLLMPILLAAKYRERDALGLLTGAGSLGLLFPPCLPLILYAIIARNTTIEEMFLGGIVPGVLLVGLTAWWGIHRGPRVEKSAPPFHFGEAKRAVWAAKWELLIPVVAVGGLFSGLATPVEAAAVTALYAYIVEVFIYRDLKLVRDVPRVMTECGLLIGGVLLILGVALGFTNWLVDAQIPTQMLEWVTTNIESKLMFLLLLNIFLLLVGCLMDIFSAIVVVVPLIVPMGEAFGIHPVHMGIIFLANMELGYLTPPVGMNLFLASYRLNKPLPEVYRSVIPMLLVLLVGVLLITYVPFLTTFLPDLFGK